MTSRVSQGLIVKQEYLRSMDWRMGLSLRGNYLYTNNFNTLAFL